MSASKYLKHLREKVGILPLMIPAVAAVILNERNELLLQRKTDGSWSLPAGMIEPKESPAQAIVREVYEETGLTAHVERILGVFGGEDYSFTYPNGDQVDYTIVLFKCRVEDENTAPRDRETESLEWFSKTSLPELALPYPLACLFAENTDGYFDKT
ncbi:NUDIX domain-containing protein [Thaumasiovibrio subtropicus]|uniref:NUDIX domain-containing protein n=1 Tax=Thaumasiovibrio subtropicus TaxID=1891207 RepID=UPI000B3543AD|nr:NUDIX domain-containing protein [Thaumasiovibrio subtropicus]